VICLISTQTNPKILIKAFFRKILRTKFIKKMENEDKQNPAETVTGAGVLEKYQKAGEICKGTQPAN
jgi:hypothetical protein